MDKQEEIDALREMVRDGADIINALIPYARGHWAAEEAQRYLDKLGAIGADNDAL